MFIFSFLFCFETENLKSNNSNLKYSPISEDGKSNPPVSITIFGDEFQDNSKASILFDKTGCMNPSDEKVTEVWS